MVTVHLNNSPSNFKILQLRDLLKAQFPEAHADRLPGRDDDDAKVVTGLPVLDAVGLEKGMLCEAVAERASLGSALLITSVLRSIAAMQQYVVLIDGRDAFDPHSLGYEACRYVLWLRCQRAAEAMKAADLLLRDGNLPLVLMDLEWNPRHELGRVPSSSWFRLRTLIEKTDATLLVVTPVQLISSAHLRIKLTNKFTTNDIERPEQELREAFALTVTRHQRDRQQSVGTDDG